MPRARSNAGVGFSIFRQPVLTWIGAHRLVTSHQVLHRFWVLAGRDPSHGFRVLRHLAAAGLIARRPLDPCRGRASVQVLNLTQRGWKEVGPHVRGPYVANAHLLQIAHVALLREVEGWRFVPPDEVWPLLRALGIRAVRSSAKAHRAQDVRLIEHIADPNLKLWALAHDPSAELRLLVPVRSLASLPRISRRLLALVFLAELFPIQLELVAGDVELATAAEAWIRRWFGGARYLGPREKAAGRPRRAMPVVLHQVPNFRSLPHPAAASIPAVSVYEANAVQNPLTLRLSGDWMATRAGGVV